MATDDLQAFAQQVETFFADRCTRLVRDRVWGEGADSVVAAALASGDESSEDIERARSFQCELYDAGLAWLTGPAEYGGAELTADHVEVFRRIAATYDAPDTSVFMIGQRIVAPAVLLHGSPAQKDRWLRSIWRGEAIACQMFSEPDAGSDLAGLRCRARRDGEGWRITGEKVWSSGAHVSDVGELLARTEGDEALRHKGLSMFLVDLQTPGVTVQPLRQMNGNAHFNQIFLDDVWVPDEAMLGERGAGWAVANASLESERDLAPDDTGLFLDPVGRLIELAQHLGASDRPEHRQQLADSHARERIAQWLRESLADRDDRVAHVSASLTKLYDSSLVWDVAQRASRILGPSITANTGAWGLYCWSDVVLGAHSQRIAGGTDEIQRNIIAERGLGLPREPRPQSKGASTK